MHRGERAVVAASAPASLRSVRFAVDGKPFAVDRERGTRESGYRAAGDEARHAHADGVRGRDERLRLGRAESAPVQRVAVVTGASSGIGEELARLLASRGWHCVLFARRAQRLRPLAESIGGEYELCDVSDRASVEQAAARVLERHPEIKLLVNNAGVAGRATFLDGDPEAFETVMRTNYFGGIWCLRAFLPALEAAAPADVVNVVSVAGVVAFPPSGPTPRRSTPSSPSRVRPQRNCAHAASGCTR